MGYVAASLACLLFAAALYLIHRERQFASLRVREVERHQRELDLAYTRARARESELLDRLAHAYDKPWGEPPEPVARENDGDEDEEEALTLDMSHLGAEEEFEPVVPGGSF